MKVNETATFFGTSYTAVKYDDKPLKFDANDINAMFDDPQCKLCAIEPNYCKMQKDCHRRHPFIFVKSQYVRYF